MTVVFTQYQPSADLVDLVARTVAAAQGVEVFADPRMASPSWEPVRDAYREDARAVLAALAGIDKLVTPAGQPAHDVDPRAAPCDYCSTWCMHGVHGRCRLTCKICAATCGCGCPEDAARFTELGLNGPA